MIDENGNNNKLNSFMDHGWDGFYTSQKRLQRFPAMVQAGTNYTVQMTGTPPKDMRFALRADAGEGGMKVLIPFPGPVAFSVYAAEGNDDLEKVTENPFLDVLGKPAPVEGSQCGQNAYFPRANYLDFWITPGCVVELRFRDSISSSVRVDWTLDEFFADGGTSAFIDRLASVLGIDASRIRVLQVYEGSVIILSEVIENEE